MGIESEDICAAGHGGEGGCANDEEAGSAGGSHADETHEGRAAEDDDRVGQGMETAGDGDVRDLGLQVHPSWGRCHRLLEDNDEFILKGEEKEVRLVWMVVYLVSHIILRIIVRARAHTHIRTHTQTGVFAAASRNSNRTTDLYAVRSLEACGCIGDITADAAAVHLLAAAEEGSASAQTLQQHHGANCCAGSLPAKVDL